MSSEGGCRGNWNTARPSPTRHCSLCTCVHPNAKKFYCLHSKKHISRESCVIARDIHGLALGVEGTPTLLVCKMKLIYPSCFNQANNHSNSSNSPSWNLQAITPLAVFLMSRSSLIVNLRRKSVRRNNLEIPVAVLLCVQPFVIYVVTAL